MKELKSNVEWKMWGAEDPLYGVASWANKQKSGSSPWTDEEFYELGASDWADFLHHWRQYGVDTRSCLEIGCGAGRMTRQLAGTFERVYAVDVSESMIDRARKGIDRGNVEFSLIDGLHLPQQDSSVSAVFSTHVIQHLDSEEIGYSYFGEFFRDLAPGGTIMIHLPLYQLPREAGVMATLMRLLYKSSRKLAGLRANLRRRSGIKMMRGTPYPIRSLNNVLEGLGFRNIEFRIFAPRSNGDPHPFVFATKPALANPASS